MEIISLVFIIIIFLFSVVIHEVSHGAMANALGDPTARLMGRLTLNPLKHLDPIGSVIVPLFLILISLGTGGGIIFGWAKPVPFNPYNLRDQRWGPAKVAAAGPAANFLVALVFGLFIRFFPLSLFPITQNLLVLFSYIVWVNLLLGIFNLLPIPPLDGSHILFALLPASLENLKLTLQKYGFIILIFFIFLFFQLLIPLIQWIFQFIVGYSLF